MPGVGIGEFEIGVSPIEGTNAPPVSKVGTQGSSTRPDGALIGEIGGPDSGFQIVMEGGSAIGREGGRGNHLLTIDMIVDMGYGPEGKCMAQRLSVLHPGTKLIESWASRRGLWE